MDMEICWLTYTYMYSYTHMYFYYNSLAFLSFSLTLGVIVKVSQVSGGKINKECL